MKRLVIFDFDDTLVTTDAKIRVLNKSLRLSTSEFAHYNIQPEDILDFSEFHTPTLANPKTTDFFNNIFYRIIKTNSDIMILTARQFTNTVRDFLSKYINEDRLQIIGHAETPEKKKKAIEQIMHKYDDIRFYDDSPKNVEAVRNLKHLKVKAQIVKK
jgi:FMN phosphatase YigB (HAD superfamily)